MCNVGRGVEEESRGSWVHVVLPLVLRIVRGLLMCDVGRGMEEDGLEAMMLLFLDVLRDQ